MIKKKREKERGKPRTERNIFNRGHVLKYSGYYV